MRRKMDAKSKTICLLFMVALELAVPIGPAKKVKT